jgi:uncharacterized protein (DUF427 family)
MTLTLSHGPLSGHRHIRVRVDGATIAASERPKILSETGLVNRYYIPPEDVRQELLEPSDKRTTCPYKGNASYRTLCIGERKIENAAWVYPEPLEAAFKVRDHLCFAAEGVIVEVDGERME